MKKFEIEACLPVTATVTDVYQIEAKTKEELQKYLNLETLIM